MHLAQSADADRMPSGGSEHSTAGACFRMPDNGWLRVIFDTCIAEGGGGVAAEAPRRVFDSS